MDSRDTLMAGNGTRSALRVGLIDCLQFSRDCLTIALSTDLICRPFATIEEFAESHSHADVLLFYTHGDYLFAKMFSEQVKQVRDAAGPIPVIILSDARNATYPKTIREALSDGARGFIPTLTTDLAATLTAIRFVNDGGTFAPLDSLLGHHPAPVLPVPNSLTPRQMAVFSLLREGKENKIIAYELALTESTVKVHIRVIMTKLGARNRTHAVYIAQQWGLGAP